VQREKLHAALTFSWREKMRDAAIKALAALQWYYACMPSRLAAEAIRSLQEALAKDQA